MDFSNLNANLAPSALANADGALSQAQATPADAIGYLLSLYTGRRRDMPPELSDMLFGLDWLAYKRRQHSAAGVLTLARSVSGREIKGCAYQFTNAGLERQYADTLAALRDPTRGEERRAIVKHYLRVDSNVYR